MHVSAVPGGGWSLSLLIPFLIILILILLNGLYVAAEFAIVGVRPSRVEQLAEEGSKVARLVEKIVDNPRSIDRYIATSQLGITLASLGLGMYAEPVIAHLVEEPLHGLFGLSEAVLHTISFIFALTLITYLHVVIGEMVPKSLALQNPERMVLSLATPMQLSQRLFSVPVTVLNGIGNAVMRWLGIPPIGEGSRVYTAADLELIVSESREGGLVLEEERDLVENIFDFSEHRVVQVMTPRTRMHAIPVSIREKELVSLVETSPHNRIPVYEGSVDNILGILHLKDFVRQQVSGEPFHLPVLLREIPFVPETLHIDHLLASFRRQRVHLAIVIDEHGGTLGVVTLEDLIEEIVGEVQDEFDIGEQAPLSIVEPGHILARGTVLLEDIEELVDLGEFDYDIETIAGLAMAELGLPPTKGDSVNINGVQLRVEEVSGLSIDLVSLYYPPEKARDS